MHVQGASGIVPVQDVPEAIEMPIGERFQRQQQQAMPGTSS